MGLLRQKITTLIIILPMCIVLPFCGKNKASSITTPLPSTTKKFTNPIINGSDPWIMKKDGFYYYSHTLGNRVALWKTTAVSKLGLITSTLVYKAAPGKPNAENVWAPELHFLEGKWYIYYTAGTGTDDSQRTWVLENSNVDPLSDTWIDKGRIFSTDADFWAIDGTVLEHNGIKYFLWSGRPNPAVQNQNIYIAKMVNPWTLQGPALMLTKPELPWEIIGGPVNEAPQILKNSSGGIFLIYSASGCWTDDYALGMLSLKEGGNPLVSSDWIKKSFPVFLKNTGNNAFGPGHNAFFKSNDGIEDWIIYHANNNSGQGCAENRNIRMQKFVWNTDGTPNFGEPLQTGILINIPSGE